MKYVNIERVSIKNFLSVGDEPVVVDFSEGLNIITGHNKDKMDRRNGVGKSTVADSVYFAIFGSTLRELKKEHIVNNTNQLGCEVELCFNINHDGITNKYKILRKLSPTKCYLYKDDEDITRDTIQNTTQYIQDLLNTTPEVFQNCVIMTINNATPFMAKKKLEKRKFIEGIFNLQVFSNMLADARQEYNAVSKELDVECARYEEISNTLAAQQEQKSNAEEDRKRSLDKLKKRLDSCAKEIKLLKEQKSTFVQIDTDDISSKIDQIDEYVVKADDTVQKNTSNEAKVSAQIEMLSKRYKQMSTSHSTCPTCLRGLDQTHVEYIENEKQSIKKEIETLTEDKLRYTRKIKDATELKATLRTKRRSQTNRLQQAQIEKHKHTNLQQQIEQKTTQQKDIVDDIAAVEKNQNTFDNIITETTKRLEQNQLVIDTIKKQLSKLEIIKFIVSEEGVKSYIVKKMLQLFNAKLAYYLKKMDSNCICVFNEYFEDEIIDEKGKPCSYFNFSGAERKNVDLACLFAFMDMRRLQGDVAFNFSMYDELFDSSLDERGVELVIEILKERIENHNECVMVISHRKESTKHATGEVIFLEKQNGLTTRVETPVNELK